jgi:hypothetical protein
MEIVKVLAGNRQIENDEKGQMITLFSHFEKLMITCRNLPWKRRFRVQRLGRSQWRPSEYIANSNNSEFSAILA